MTLAELKDRTLKRLDDSSTAPAVVSAAEVVASLNRAERLFAFITLCIERTARVILSAEESWYTLEEQIPGFFLPLRCMQRPLVTAPALWNGSSWDVPVWDELAAERGAAARVRPSRIADLDALDSDWQLARNNTTERYGVIGRDLMFVYPAPVIENVDMDLTHAAIPSPMTRENDEPAIPAQYQMYLPLFAVWDLRLKDGGVELERTKPFLDQFLNHADRCADTVRARSRAQQYEHEPFELKSFDRSRLVAALKAKREKPE